MMKVKLKEIFFSFLGVLLMVFTVMYFSGAFSCSKIINQDVCYVSSLDSRTVGINTDKQSKKY